MNGIIFDLDGTLIDSAPAVREALNKTLLGAGFTALAIDDVKGMIGQGMPAMMAKALEHFGKAASQTAIDELCGSYIEHYLDGTAEHTFIYPGVMETLERLKAADYRMGICTNKPSSLTYPVITACRFDPLFTAISCGDSLPFKKPDARHIYSVLEKMDCEKSSSVFVGDSEWDIEAAQNAGIPVIAVDYGYSGSPLEDFSPDLLIGRFDELPEALKFIAELAAS